MTDTTSPAAPDVAIDAATDAVPTPEVVGQYQGPHGLEESSLALDTNARHWIAAGGWDRNLGGAVLSQIHEREAARAAALQRESESDSPSGTPPTPSAGEAEIAMRTSAATLQRLWGDEAFSQNMSLARELVQHIEAQRPGFMAYMEDSGLWNDPLFVAGLVHQAQRLNEGGSK